jgi:hypothetical protein
MSVGVSIALGWFALLEWHNKRQWERYRRNWVAHERTTAEEATRTGMTERPDRDDTKP